MSEKMLVTQALDERVLLVRKIADKIEKASFVDTIKPNEEIILPESTSAQFSSFLWCYSIEKCRCNTIIR